MRVDPPSRPSATDARAGVATLALLALVACGGGGGDPAPGDASPGTAPSTSAPVPSSPVSPTSSPDAAPPVGADSGAGADIGTGTGANIEADIGADAAEFADAVDVPHGLDRRPPLADFALPIDGGGSGGYRTVPAYPNLEPFLEALRAAPVPGERRMVVVEQAGRIKVFDDDPAVETASTILDFRETVSFSSERGLLGFAFDPAFRSNRFVYVYYTRAGDGRSIVSRLTWDAASDTLDPSSETRILEVEQPYGNHNAGMIEFGPDDGYLYIALGDGGDGGDPLNHAQDRSTLLGSILRIDVHPDDPNVAYAIPPDNPFVDVDGARPEIYAHGFRNPYRFSFDRQNGELWAGDVGQGRFEEIDLVVAGGNYGWRVFEGTRERQDPLNTLPESAFIPPVHEYGHDVGVAVIGGYVYRGDRVPSLFGRYLFADFGSGTVWALERDGDGGVEVESLVTVEGPTSFAESADGDVMVISRYGGLLRLEPENPGAELPARLSETGLFADLTTLTPAEGLIGYAPSHPFWSDGTRKRRWLGVPDDERIGFTADDWTFPPGSVSVKHFEIDLIENDPGSSRRLETRVLLHTRSGWEGYTYRWNAAQTDAVLLNGRETERLEIALASGGTREQRYDYPSRADCAVCHTRAAGFLLGPKTAQLNAPFAYPAGRANQLATLDHVGLLDGDVGAVAEHARFAPLGDESRSIEDRARAYLDVNCSSCHMPGGSAPTTMDLRAGIPLEAMDVVDAAPSVGDLGIADARIIRAGNRESSVLWQRIARTDETRMPPLSTHVVDTLGVELVGRWIDGLR